MRAVLLKLLLGLLLSTLLILSYLFLPHKVFALDSQLRDFFFSQRGALPHTDTPRVVIVDIDEKSIRALGQWPWRRDIISRLLEQITHYRPGIIGLDILFAEPDRSSPHRIQADYPDLNLTTLPDYDRLLAHTFETTPVVGGYIFRFDESGTHEPPLLPAIFIAPKESGLLSPHSLTLNTPLLQHALYSSGFFNNLPDENGMIRKVPLLMAYDGMIFSSLALEMVRIYSGANRVELIPQSIDTSQVKFGAFRVPVDHFGQFTVNFRGAKHHFPYLSAIDLLNGTIDPTAIEGKFVLVGTSALGLYDLRSTTYDSNIPGVEIHANTIDNLLQGDYLATPPNHVLLDIGLIVLVMFGTLLLLHFVPSLLLLPLALGLLGVLTYGFYTLLFGYGVVLSLLFPLLTYLLAVLLSIGVDYFISQRQKEVIKTILGKKVSIGVMHHLLKHQDETLVRPREVDATLFFSDIQGFTSISETIDSPTRLIELLNSYMTPMVESIIAHKGTIDKFIGDAIMAYWNAPLPVPNHADQALSSALEQLRELQRINQSIYAEFGLRIKIGIGIHSGVVTAGDMGSQGRSDYTVIGDNVNLASRLEGLTRYYGVTLLISAQTKARLTKIYTLRPIDIVEVKGKREAVEIFEVRWEREAIDTTEDTTYLRAIEAFRAGRLREAERHFTQLQAYNPQRLYEQYLTRCHYYLSRPDTPFEPILKMTTK